MASAIEAFHPAVTGTPRPGLGGLAEREPLVLFSVAPHQAALIALHHMESSLCDECEVVGLLCGALGKPFESSTTVEGLAGQIVAKIRRRQPRGPYCIAGFSLGGLVAYQVAGRLRDEGEIINWLGLIDTCDPDLMRRHRVRSSLAQRRGHLARRLGVRLRIWLTRQRSFPGAFPSDQFDFVGARETALRHSVTGHDAPLDVFISEASATAYGRRAGWDRLHRGELVVHSVPGNHDTVLHAPQAAVIAGIMHGRLDEIRAHRLGGAT